MIKTLAPTKNDWLLYSRLMGFARPYWKVIIALLFAVLLGAAMEPLMPALMKPLIDESLIAGDKTSLWAIPLLMVLVVTLRGVADYAVTYLSQYLSQRVVEDLRQAVFAIELDLPFGGAEMADAGRRISRITYDTQLVSEAVSEVWLVLVRDALVLVGLVAFLFYTAWQLSIFVFVSLPILVFAVRKISTRLRFSSKQAQEKYGTLTGFLQEAFLGLFEIKLFNAYRMQEQAFHKLNRDFRKEQMKVARSSALAGPIVAILTAVTVAVVIYFASFMTSRGELTPGEFVAFITGLAMVFGPIRRLTAVHVVLQRGLAAAESIFAQLDSGSESRQRRGVMDLAHGHQTNAATVQAALDFRGEIELDNVWFRYPHQETYALRDLNLHVRRHERIAIIGPSGSGKSTILALIAGFYTPESGRVLLDGESVSNICPLELRSSLGFVSQHVTLFNGTIRQNITLGNDQVSNTKVIAAAKAANVMEFADKLPLGLDTPLGSLGGRLSGGQRQRISIARAFLRDAQILLLDEVTSALDRESESAVLASLETLMTGRTVLMVSHSPERILGITRVFRLTSD